MGGATAARTCQCQRVCVCVFDQHWSHLFLAVYIYLYICFPLFLLNAICTISRDVTEKSKSRERGSRGLMIR